MKVYFIDLTTSLTHVETNGIAIGASEHQFYSLIQELTKVGYSVTVFNKISENKTIDDINYINFENIYDMEEEIGTKSFIIQKFKPTQLKFNEIFKENKKILWAHDIPADYVFKYDCDQNDINLFYANKAAFFKKYLDDNIYYIFNSNFNKNLYLDMYKSYNIVLKEDRYNIIYNVLYEKEFENIVKKEPKNEYIVFASAWNKGILIIIDLFRILSQIDKQIKLILMCPGYGHDRFKDYEKTIKNEFGTRVIILGSLNKKEFARVISGAICVLTTTFPETFGCTFAESYYLGTPVLADYRSGATKEIIDNKYIINFNNPSEFIQKIFELKTSRPKVKLDDKFKLEYNLNLWKKLLDN